LHKGDYKGADALFKGSLIEARDLKAPHIVSEHLMALADVAIQAAEADRGARLLGASDSLNEKMGYVLSPFEREVFDRYVAAARGALDEEQFSAAWAEAKSPIGFSPTQLPLIPSMLLAMRSRAPGPVWIGTNTGG
jgi:hypothetical protein